MCDFGISATVAGVSAGIAASSAAAGSAAAATAVAAPTIAAAAAGTLALAPTVGTLGVLGSSIGAGSTVASAAAAAATGGIGIAEGIGIASLVASLAATGGSTGAAAKQAKDQGQLSKQKARIEAANVEVQAGQEAEAAGQKNFQLAQAALTARGEVDASNLGDRSVRAIGRSVGFQLGADKATVKRNQEIANTVATARLRGIQITRASDKLQIGDPATIAGTGAVATLASGLQAGAGAYNAFSKFKVPNPNLAFA